VPGGAHASGFEAHTTNQRMEITAALEAVRALPGPLEIVSDSTYVVNCFRDRWHEGWRARGWKTSAKKPVANRDLWEPLIDLVLARGDVTFRWVKGHSEDPMNDLVDRLAVEAAMTQSARSGDAPPTELGPAEQVGVAAGSGRDPRLPAGRLLAVFGHRPGELGGYGESAVAARVRRKLVEIITAKHALHADLAVVSGMRLGAEQLGAEAAIEAGVPLVAVLPYPSPESVWPKAAQAHFHELLEEAEVVITLGRTVPASKQRAGAALARRDAWLARNVDEAVVVWDGQDELLGRLFRSLEDHLGEDVWIVEPGG
jgi:ribonuclease HI